MQPLHPVDAFSPAFRRTSETMLKPFKVGRTFRLCACSYLAFAGSIFIPFPLLLLLTPRAAWQEAGAPMAIIAGVVIFFTAFYFGMFYVGNRMAFVEFEMLVTRSKVVGPMWSRYGGRTWPYLGLKMLIGTVVSVALAPLLIGRFKALATLVPAQAAPGTPVDPAVFMALFAQMAGLYALFFAIYFTIKLFDTLLNDFVLPFYAIEEIPLFTAIARGWEVVRREPGTILLYLLCKIGLAIVGYIALSLAALVCELVFGLLGALMVLIGTLITQLLPGAAGHLVVVVGAVVLGGIIFVAFLAVIIGCSGYLFSVLEAYAIYFLGGRYQRLGDYLEPAAYTYAPPPLPPSKEENDGGPSLPMDPALVLIIRQSSSWCAHES